MSKQTEDNRKSNGQYKKGFSGNPKTQFKAGNNANPNGRRGALADIIKKVWDEEDETGLTKKEKMVRRVLSMAMNGSMSAVSYLSDRAEGKAKETREISHKTEPIKILSID
jgi:hypothetical protein|tara:strand:- start:315 stop:647 length:333 start_codon:yes stop_codon:yes gene_type:complete